MSVKDSRIVYVLRIRWFTVNFCSVNTSDSFLSTATLTVSASIRSLSDSISGSSVMVSNFFPKEMKRDTASPESLSTVSSRVSSIATPEAMVAGSKGIKTTRLLSLHGIVKSAANKLHTLGYKSTHLKLLQRPRSLSVLRVTIPTDLATVECLLKCILHQH